MPNTETPPEVTFRNQLIARIKYNVSRIERCEDDIEGFRATLSRRIEPWDEGADQQETARPRPVCVDEVAAVVRAIARSDAERKEHVEARIVLLSTLQDFDHLFPEHATPEDE